MRKHRRTKMLIYHSLTGKMCETEDIKLIDPLFNGKRAATVAFPLSLGTIAHIGGFEEIKVIPGVVDVTIYYSEGHQCEPKHINTLDQLFARGMIVKESKKELRNCLEEIRRLASVIDTNGNDMIRWSTFDKIIEKLS